MTTITVSPKFQIVIPKEVRETTNIKTGMRLVMLPYGNRIELIPLKSMSQLKGSLKGMDTSNIREKQDRT
jgi:AbrB family looped-hinge helix DNA binding protein